MGSACTAKCWLGVCSILVSAAPVPGAVSSSERLCPPLSNSTKDFLRCLSWRQEHGIADLDEDTHQPTADAEDSTTEYFAEISRNRERISSFSNQRLNIFTEKLIASLHDFSQDKHKLPRVFVLGEWDDACEMMRETLGYRYSMEHWFWGMLTSNKALVVEDHRAADFVYLPHCATGVFMHMVVQDVRELKEKKSAHVPKRPITWWNTLPSNASAAARKRRGEEFLYYEGNLPAKSVIRLDDTYLMQRWKMYWKDAPEYAACMQRASCKFLIGSIYGRHVWRGLASIFGDKAIFVTHAGMSTWLRKQPDSLFISSGRESGKIVDRKPTLTSGCRTSCELHCQHDPPPVLHEDIVLPWVIAFEWTHRSAMFRTRDILAFYSGTENSCSRKLLRQTFDDRFQQEMNFASRAKSRVLVFPPEFRLRQQDWSELAYRSKICICPDGDSPNTGRLIEVVMHGCVPLIISNRLQPPYHEYIDWSKVAFFMREDLIPELPRILEERFATPTGQGELAEKQKLLQQLSFIADYSRDGVTSTLTIALRERALKLRALDPDP